MKKQNELDYFQSIIDASQRLLEVKMRQIENRILEKEGKRLNVDKELEKLVRKDLESRGFLGRKDSQKIREKIPQEIKNVVWNRDRGKCVECGSNENLEFDHIIPVSKGGANTYRNLQLLCEPCNRKKSNKIG